MANPRHLAKLQEGIRAWNQWNDPLKRPDLAGEDFSGSNLIGANFSRVNFGFANFRGAKLRTTSFRAANLSGADFSKANLGRTNLRMANFTGADLSEANIKGAQFQWTVLANTNLVGTKGLNHCKHFGPSSVGIDTLFQSKGEIPNSFLRGCGVPELLITYMRSLLIQPIEFYSCFISYSMMDHDFADRLHADLQNKGVRCWFAPHDIQGGKKIHEQVDEAIRVYDRLLLILSDASMNSQWVQTEIAKARKREMQEKRRMLFPVRLVDFEKLQQWECFDADTGKDSAREIREYFVPDFSNWKNHDAYKKAFARLLHDLKADTQNTLVGE